MSLLSHYSIILHSSSSSSSFPVLWNSSSSQLFKFSKLSSNIQRPLSIFSLSIPNYKFPVPHSSNSAIFLPFLQEEPNPLTQQIPEQEPTSKDQTLEAEVDNDDPMLKFFKGRIADPDGDPVRLGKLTLQKNRKTAWHLAFEADDSLQEEDELEESNSGPPPAALDAGSAKVGGVVEEILQKSRTLPENTTLGEVLGGFEGRVNAKDCVEVLELMGQEGLIKGCLYFFEWMGLNEPSLVSPRACSILFPILGREGLGDEIMVFFTNLPKERRFRDVHVYNAAISGLLCCRRYYHCSHFCCSFVSIGFCMFIFSCVVVASNWVL